MMLNYFKLILEKVSFDAHLFEKELKKSMNELFNEDLKELEKWCYENFGTQYSNILRRSFASKEQFV